MHPALLTLSTFLAGVLIIIGLYSILSDLFLRDRSRISQRLEEEFRKQRLDRLRKTALFKNLSAQAEDSALPDDEESGLRHWFGLVVEQSGMGLTVQRLLGIMICAGLGLGLLGLLFSRSIILSMVLALLGGSVPWLYVYIRRRLRLHKMMAQLPHAFDLMARVIRAGQTMAQALVAVADEFSEPLSIEFAFCYEQQNLGLPPEQALRNLARRTGLLEIKIFVLALLVQQQSGGNLAELLDKLATIMRDRARISGKIRSLTAEGRVQAIVLLALPLALLLIISLLNPGYVQVLFDHPVLLAGLLVSELLGALWIRRIVNFDF